jgi:hypothetical protein
MTTMRAPGGSRYYTERRRCVVGPGGIIEGVADEDAASLAAQGCRVVSQNFPGAGDADNLSWPSVASNVWTRLSSR